MFISTDSFHSSSCGLLLKVLSLIGLHWSYSWYWLLDFYKLQAQELNINSKVCYSESCSERPAEDVYRVADKR